MHEFKQMKRLMSTIMYYQYEYIPIKKNISNMTNMRAFVVTKADSRRYKTEKQGTTTK